MIRMLAALAVTLAGLVLASLWLDGVGAPRRAQDPVGVAPEAGDSDPISGSGSPQLAVRDRLDEDLLQVVESAVQAVETVAEIALPEVLPEPDTLPELDTLPEPEPAEQSPSVLVYEPTGRYEPPPLLSPSVAVPEPRPEAEAEVWRFEEDDTQGRAGETDFAVEKAPDNSPERAVSLDDRSRLIRRLLDVYARIESAP